MAYIKTFIVPHLHCFSDQNQVLIVTYLLLQWFTLNLHAEMLQNHLYIYINKKIICILNKLENMHFNKNSCVQLQKSYLHDYKFAAYMHPEMKLQ